MKPPTTSRFVLATLITVCVALGGGCRKAPVAVVETRVPPPEKSAPKAADVPARPNPRLLPDEELPDLETVRAGLAEARRLLLELEGRPLSASETETKATAEGFLLQADDALAQGDITRTTLLVEKARILLDELLEDDR